MALKRGDPVPEDATPAVKELAQAFVRNWCVQATEKARAKETAAKAAEKEYRKRSVAEWCTTTPA